MFEKLDGWMNVLTGLGMKNRDKKMSSTLEFEVMSKGDAEVLYAGEDTAEKIVDVLPEDMTRVGWNLAINEDQERGTKVLEELEKLGYEDKIRMALKQARLYGGSAILLGVDDGMKPDEPLDLARVKKLKWIQVLNRHDLNPARIDYKVSSPTFKKPIMYRLNAFASTTEDQNAENANDEYIDIHASRLIIFDGATLPEQLYITNNYWHDSVLNKAKSTITGYATAYENIYSIIQDFIQGIFKIKNLTNYIANGKDDLVTKRLQLVDAKRSMIKSIVVDADGEEFTRDVANLGGLPAVVDKLEKRLTQVGNMPHTKMMGEGAAGTLGGGGESELKEWYDYVDRKRKKDLKPKLITLTQVANVAHGGKPDDVLDFEFESLWTLPDQVKADIRQKMSAADSAYITNNVLTPEEVAKSRFGKDQYSVETELDPNIDREFKELDTDIDEDEDILDPPPVDEDEDGDQE